MADYNLKKPEEVKEYLTNLHIEYKFGCYNEKKPEVCHLLADFSEAIKKDFKKAALLYKSTCDDYNYAQSCTKYGNYSLIGKACKEDPVEGFKYMRKACEFGDKKGCFYVGALALSNTNVGEKDRAAEVALGVKMLTDSCAAGFEKACFYLSGVYLSGVEGYVDKNIKEAYKLSLKCCEEGNPFACANISQMHSRGDGVQQSPDLAEVFKQRALMLQKEMQKHRKTVTPH